MAILLSDIVSRCASALDAENDPTFATGYYTFAQDYRPAILSAQDWVVSVINSQLGKKKLSEEIFSDLRFARVFQMSTYSRVRLDPAVLGHDIWTITSIEPLPTTLPAFVVQTLTNPQDSKYRNDLSHLTTNFFAQRTTDEEWARNKNNPFHDSHALETGEVASSYGFINYTDYTSSGYTLNAPPNEIEIRPSIAGLPVTIRYIRTPSRPVSINDSILFPKMAFDIIVSAVLAYMAVKQGDNTTLEGLSNKFLQTLIIPNT